MAPPAAGGGRFVFLSRFLVHSPSLSPSLSFPHSFVHGTSVGAALRSTIYARWTTTITIARGDHHQHTLTIVSRLASLIPRGALAVTNTINDASCHALRLVLICALDFVGAASATTSASSLLSCSLSYLPPFRVVSSTARAFLLFDLERRLCSSQQSLLDRSVSLFLSSRCIRVHGVCPANRVESSRRPTIRI